MTNILQLIREILITNELAEKLTPEQKQEILNKIPIEEQEKLSELLRNFRNSLPKLEDIK